MSSLENDAGSGVLIQHIPSGVAIDSNDLIEGKGGEEDAAAFGEVENLVNQANAMLGPQSLSIVHRRWVFTLLIVCQAMTNLDSGAVAAIIGDDGPMTKALELSRAEEGFLGSVVYIGNTVGCAATGLLFNHFSAKTLLWTFTLVNAGFAAMFAASPNFATSIVSRLFCGFSHGVLMVYAPVWVDEFAPKIATTTWMSLVQAGVPIGIMLGYVCAGAVTASSPDEWRWIFYAQAVALGFLTLLLLWAPACYLNQSIECEVDEEDLEDLPNEPLEHGGGDPLSATVALDHKTSAVSSKAGGDTSTASPKKSSNNTLAAQIKTLLSNSLFMSTTMTLCSLYFVVTGLQLWVTAYLQDDPINADLSAIVPAFGLTSATGPVLGVVCGGILLDKLGGYAHVDRAAELGCIIGLCALVPAYACLFVENFWIFIADIWIMLFFGGAVVPIATGLVISSASLEHRNLASSILGIFSNLFGYFLGPALCGIVADAIDDLRWGFRLVMGWSVFALLSMIVAVKAARRVARAQAQRERQLKAVTEGTGEVTTPRSSESVISDDIPLDGTLINRDAVVRAAAQAMNASFVVPKHTCVTLRANTSLIGSFAAPTPSAATADVLQRNTSFAALSRADLKGTLRERNAALQKALEENPSLCSVPNESLAGAGHVNSPVVPGLRARRQTVKFKVNPRIAALQQRRSSLVSASQTSAGRQHLSPSLHGAAPVAVVGSPPQNLLHLPDVSILDSDTGSHTHSSH
eukprot:PhM_4_TR422/c0_g1_i1/m.15085